MRKRLLRCWNNLAKFKPTSQSWISLMATWESMLNNPSLGMCHFWWVAWSHLNPFCWTMRISKSMYQMVIFTLFFNSKLSNLFSRFSKAVGQQGFALQTMSKQDCVGWKRKRKRLRCNSIFDWKWLEPGGDQMFGSGSCPKNLAIEAEIGRWTSPRPSWKKDHVSWKILQNSKDF